MAPPDAVVIINPVSGPARRGGASERAEIVRHAVEALGSHVEIHLTERPGHAYELARDAVGRGIGVGIAWGGDGTINEVACALVRTPVALGIIPGGSGNGLARELGIPFDPRLAIARAMSARARTIDAGELGGRMFFNMAGIGLDAHVAGTVAKRLERRGLIPYLVAIAKDLASYRPLDYSIEADGLTTHAEALLVAFANSRQYGFNTRVAPTAVIDDGLLDLVIVEGRTLAGNLLRLPSLFAGMFHRMPGVKVLKVREATVRAGAPMRFHVDGEAMQGGTELVARVHAGALRVRA